MDVRTLWPLEQRRESPCARGEARGGARGHRWHTACSASQTAAHTASHTAGQGASHTAAHTASQTAGQGAHKAAHTAAHGGAHAASQTAAQIAAHAAAQKEAQQPLYGPARQGHVATTAPLEQRQPAKGAPPHLEGPTTDTWQLPRAPSSDAASSSSWLQAKVSGESSTEESCRQQPLVPYSAPLPLVPDSTPLPRPRRTAAPAAPAPAAGGGGVATQAHPLPPSHPFGLRSSSEPESLVSHSAPLPQAKALGHQGCTAVPYSEPLPQGKPLPRLTQSQPLLHRAHTGPVAHPAQSQPLVHRARTAPVAHPLPSSIPSGSHSPSLPSEALASSSQPMAQPKPLMQGQPQVYHRHATTLPAPSAGAQPLAASGRPPGAPGAATGALQAESRGDGPAAHLRVLDHPLRPLPRGSSTGGEARPGKQSLVVLPSGRVLDLTELWTPAGEGSAHQQHSQSHEGVGPGCVPSVQLSDLLSRSAPLMPSVAAAFLPQYVSLPSPWEGREEGEGRGEGEEGGEEGAGQRGLAQRKHAEEEVEVRSTSVERGSRANHRGKAVSQLAQSQLVQLQQSGGRVFMLPPPPLAEASSAVEGPLGLFQKLQRRKAIA